MPFGACWHNDKNHDTRLHHNYEKPCRKGQVLQGFYRWHPYPCRVIPCHVVLLLKSGDMGFLRQEMMVGGQLYRRTRKSASQPFGGWMRVITTKKYSIEDKIKGNGCPTNIH